MTLNKNCQLNKIWYLKKEGKESIQRHDHLRELGDHLVDIALKNQLSIFFRCYRPTVTPQNRYVFISPIWTSLLDNHIVSLASARPLRELEQLNRNCHQRKYIHIVLCYSHVFHKHVKRNYIPLLFHWETGPLSNTRDGWRSVQNT